MWKTRHATEPARFSARRQPKTSLGAFASRQEGRLRVKGHQPDLPDKGEQNDHQAN
jgi:hypothetical protein